MLLPAGDLISHGNNDAVFNLGDIAWVLTSTALVWIMIPGVAFFYSGLLRRKNALSQLWLGMVTVGVISVQVSLNRHSSQSKLTRLTTSTVVLLGLLLDFLRRCKPFHW